MDLKKIAELRTEYQKLVVEHQELKRQYDHLTSIFGQLASHKIKEFTLHGSEDAKNVKEEHVYLTRVFFYKEQSHEVAQRPGYGSPA